MSQFVFVLKKKIKTSLSPDRQSRRRRMKKASVAMTAVAAVGMEAPIGCDFRECIRTENKDESSIFPGNCGVVASSANSSFFVVVPLPMECILSRQMLKVLGRFGHHNMPDRGISQQSRR